MTSPDMLPADAPVVDVVIPAQRAGRVLAGQLRALTEQREAPPFRVLVVVAEGDDPTRSVAADFGDVLDVLCIDAPVHGAALARNAGAAAGTGDVILFCDADDRVGPRWVHHLADEARRSGIAGGPVVVDRTSAPRWALPFYTVLEESPVQMFWGSVPYVLSASMGVRRDVFESVDGFDAAFPGAGGEEVDLCCRIGMPFGVVTDIDAALLYTPRSTFTDVLAQRVGYARGAARVATRHQSARVGRARTTDLRPLMRAARSPRRVVVMASSYVVLHREMRRSRRSDPTSGRPSTA